MAKPDIFSLKAAPPRATFTLPVVLYRPEAEPTNKLFNDDSPPVRTSSALLPALSNTLSVGESAVYVSCLTLNTTVPSKLAVGVITRLSEAVAVTGFGVQLPEEL